MSISASSTAAPAITTLGSILPSGLCKSPQPEGTITVNAPPIDKSVNIYPLTNETLVYLRSCCKGAPINAYQDGCSAYCVAMEQSVKELYDCFLDKDGRNKPGIQGSVAHEITPVNTTRTSSQTPTPTSTPTPSSTGSTGAAGRNNPVIAGMISLLLMTTLLM